MSASISAPDQAALGPRRRPSIEGEDTSPQRAFWLGRYNFNHIKPEKKHLNYGNSMCSRWRWRSMHRNVDTAHHPSEVGVYSETPRVCYRGARKTQ
jgi:hypothetical protein